MPPEMLDAIASFGPLGIASAAIFWVYIQGSKRQDGMVQSFQDHLRDQADSHGETLEGVRNRYDDVIRKYDTERLESLKEIGLRLQGIEKELEDVQAILREIRAA